MRSIILRVISEKVTASLLFPNNNSLVVRSPGPKDRAYRMSITYENELAAMCMAYMEYQKTTRTIKSKNFRRYCQL